MATSTLSDNSWQSPADTEPGGGSWHKIEDPTTGYIGSDTSPSADSFSGGLEVDFSAVVPAGTKAVRVSVSVSGSQAGKAYWRISGDSNISNTPHAGSEWSHEAGYFIATLTTRAQVVVWLSSDYKAQFAVQYNTMDVYIAYPVEYLL